MKDEKRFSIMLNDPQKMVHRSTECGLGLAKDLDEAVHWYTKSAE